MHNKKSLHKICILSFCFLFENIFVELSFIKSNFACGRLKADYHNPTTKIKQGTHPTKIIKILINK
jgi:hypothetical protein